MVAKHQKTRLKINNCIYPVELEFNNRKIKINAYLDSGNLLQFEQKPVIILDLSVFLKLSNTDLITFYINNNNKIQTNTVTGSQNLKLCKIDKITIFGNKKIEIEDKDNKEQSILKNVAFMGGCPGNAIGLAQAVKGRTVKEVYENNRLSYELESPKIIKALPYDMLISGYDSNTVSTLRLWEAKGVENTFNLSKFNNGEFIDSLKEDIRIGAVSTYSPTGILRVNSDNRIEYQREKTKKTILESNVELLYEHYVERGKFDISDVGKVEMEALLASLTEACRDKATKTIDFTEYKWTLAELLKRKQEIDNGSYQKAYLSVDENESSTELPYVFIIDEINRGELSKIFGELFYSIEPDYRGPAGRVKTQYNNMVHAGDVFKEGFFIPANVYIIGTMNDIDRGVEAMDFAIRRRFAWKEVTAAESAINMEIPEKVRAVMEVLNNALIENGLTEAHCIGGAYFRKLEGSDYKKLWNNHLKGIVTEYFRGEPEVDSKVKNIEAAYTKAQEEPAE